MAELVPTPTTEPVEDLALDADFATDDELEEATDDGPLLQWQTSAKAATTRGSSWYVVMGLIAAAIIIVAILTRTWIFIPLGVLVPVALSMYSSKGMEAHSYSLEPYGVHVDNKSYSYESFKAFFIIEDKGHTIFELVPLQRLGTLVSLHADGDEAEEILDIVSSVLPETAPQGYLGESIFRRLKF